MKKKSILMAAIAVMLVAVLVVGGTLAYFTDTKSATNTFTMGNVKIALDEQQKGENGLEAFEQNKTLVPGKSNDGNAVSKIVTVKKTGANDAWVSHQREQERSALEQLRLLQRGVQLRKLLGPRDQRRHR